MENNVKLFGKFKDLPYSRPNLKNIKKGFEKTLARFKMATTFEEADKALVEYMDIVGHWYTQYTIASIRKDMNMKDEFYDKEDKFFNQANSMLMLTLKKAIKTVLASPFRPQLEEKYGKQMFKGFEMQLKLIKPSIILPSIKEGNLETKYSKTAATASVEFMGEKCNFYGLLRHTESIDREERKSAAEKYAKLLEGISSDLDKIYGKLVKLRCTIAKRLGYKNYIQYVYDARGRYDYDAEKVAEFREAIYKYITPLCEKLYKDQAERLGLEKLEFYDEPLCFAEGNATPIGTPEELTEHARKMYEEMSPETGEFFNFMVEHELYDFVTRENKHLGGYMTFLSDYKAPFIFSNFNGTSADIDVLTHEAGHAFQGYYASRRLPLEAMNEGATSEICEIHSMAMEFFAYPWMESFFGDNADKYRYAHFTGTIKCLLYLVCVDEFQHRVFENPDMTALEWRKTWKEIERKYMPWCSYDGNEFFENGGFWMDKQHIFLYPFYYIDYAMAQLDSFALFKMKEEGKDAWGSYVKLCGMGGTYGYLETLERAGLPNPLNEETVKELAEFAEAQAEALKSRLN